MLKFRELYIIKYLKTVHYPDPDPDPLSIYIAEGPTYI